MKKTMITLAAMFAATVTMAAVTSQIVGYQTASVPVGNEIRIASFGSLGDANGDLPIATMLAGGVDGDTIQVFTADPEAPFKQYLRDGGVWIWDADPDWLETTDLLVSGTAFWYNSGGETTLTSAGELRTDLTLNLPAAGNYMVGNPLPIPYAFKNIQGGVDGDTIQVFTGDPEAPFKQYLRDGGVWIWDADPDWLETLDTIPTGIGFWYNAGGETLINFNLDRQVAN